MCIYVYILYTYRCVYIYNMYTQVSCMSLQVHCFVFSPLAPLYRWVACLSSAPKRCSGCSANWSGFCWKTIGKWWFYGIWNGIIYSKSMVFIYNLRGIPHDFVMKIMGSFPLAELG